MHSKGDHTERADAPLKIFLRDKGKLLASVLFS